MLSQYTLLSLSSSGGELWFFSHSRLANTKGENWVMNAQKGGDMINKVAMVYEKVNRTYGLQKRAVKSEEVRQR